MEDVLACYERPYDPAEPVLCLDEKSKELRSTPRKTSRPDRIDYEYKRHGTRNIFVTCEPKAGWRKISVTKRRTKIDFAHHMKELLTGRYRKARRIHAVLDNLNTHFLRPLCEALGLNAKCPPKWLKRVVWHHTPKHASWLNAAESEISVLERQCLNRRIPSEDDLRRETDAWQVERNARRVPIRWNFSRLDAQAKFPSLYQGVTTFVADH